MSAPLKTIKTYWPFDTSRPPRTSQLLAFDWLENLPSDKKYILMELPVGSGKSPLAIAYSGYLRHPFGNSFILTPQKILQKQYETSFEDHIVQSMYGRSNYECHPKNTNCDIGNTIKPKCSMCPYKDSYARALQSPNTVLNYTLALLLFKQAEMRKINPRKLMIMDEAHVLESHLTEFNAVAVSELKCKKLGIHYFAPKSAMRAMEWIEGDYYPVLVKKFSEFSRTVEELNSELEYNARSLTASERQDYKTYKEFKLHLEALDYMRGLGTDEIHTRFVYVPDKKLFKFRELYGKHVFHGLVKPMAEKFLFMSGTILNKDAYCRDLGIDPEEAAFISIPSEFPAENRPVIYSPQMKMNYEWDQDKNIEARKDMIVKIKEICDMYQDESGIIHAGNFKISEWLVENLTGLIPHDVVHHNPSAELNRNDVINEFIENSSKKPTILISPSITEGLDLKNDAARLAIFVKVPYGNLGDNWIKRRMELSNEWYSRMALTNIMQGAGRIVRSKEDYGSVFILDSSFGYLLYQTMKLVPQWWLDAYAQL